MIERVLHKRERRLFRIVIIAHGKRGSTHPEFALFIDTAKLIFIVQYEDLSVLTRTPNWDRLVVAQLAIDDEICAVKRDLDGTVPVSYTNLTLPTIYSV